MNILIAKTLPATTTKPRRVRLTDRNGQRVEFASTGIVPNDILTHLRETGLRGALTIHDGLGRAGDYVVLTEPLPVIKRDPDYPRDCREGF